MGPAGKDVAGKFFSALIQEDDAADLMKGAKLKINSFDLDLKAARAFRESSFGQVTRNFSFADIINDGLSRFQEKAVSGGETRMTSGEMSFSQTVSVSWFDSVTVQGRSALSLTDQFRFELEKVRQIMESLMSQLEGRTTGYGLSLNRFSDIYTAAALPSRQVAWEYTETRSFRYEESELTRVSAEGFVRTADNREIDFTFDCAMSRSFIRQDYFTRTQTGYALIDPLVINTGMTAPTLSGARFSFDLDLDGEAEDLPLPGPGMGFLSLDLNGDGTINDGSELFGPATGDGFGELAAYDLDDNDWIDENDPVFDRLTLWEQAESGGMTLTRIKDAGIGAIYLAGIASPFDLTTEDNELLGRVAKTSIALTEAGEVVPVQEVDYKV